MAGVSISIRRFPGSGRPCLGSGVPGLDDMAEGKRCGGNLIGLLSILISSVWMEIERVGILKSTVV